MIENRKYRLYPTPEQVSLLEETLETCRKTWNYLLSKRKEGRVSKFEQDHDVYLQKQKNPSLRRIYSHVLQNVSDRMDKSFRSFFKGIARCPKFKSFGRYNSSTYPDAYNGSVRLGTSLRRTKVYLSKIGYVPVVVHRKPSIGKNKRCTIKREGDKWFAILEYQAIHAPGSPIVKKPKSPVGIDLGLLSLIATSDGQTFKPAIPLGKHLKRLQHLQRSLCSKRKGSKNRHKAIQRISHLHWKIRSIRSDFNHKLSRSIVSRHDFFALEDLNIQGMVHNHNLARPISDAGWNQLSSFVKYKAEREGKQVVFVSPYHTDRKSVV